MEEPIKFENNIGESTVEDKILTSEIAEENRVEEIHVRRNDSSQDESENFEENND